MKNRAVDLERGIRELLTDPEGKGEWVKRLYDHPLIHGLFRGSYNPKWIKKNKRYKYRSDLPSYIPARNFALALMDIVLPAKPDRQSGATGATTSPAANAADTNPLTSLRDAASKIQGNDKLKTALLTLIDAAGDDVNKARENIEAWFDSSMDRVGGWYKRRAQVFLLLIGLAVAIAVNADTVAIFKSLANDSALRGSLVNAAEAYAKANAEPNVNANALPSPSPLPSLSFEIEACKKDSNSKECKDACDKDENKNLPECICREDEGSPQCQIAIACDEDEGSADCEIAKACVEGGGSLRCREVKACRKDETSPECKLERNLSQINGLGLPIGWDVTNQRIKPPQPPWYSLSSSAAWAFKLFGWLLTAMAISLGAPFWFDLLNKFMIVRSTVKPHEKSPEEPSVDR